MTPYTAFARYYDLLTDNVDYRARAAYFNGLIRSLRPDASLLLDLACGTGSLSYELAALGYDVTGVDASAEMLSQALGKAGDSEAKVLFLRQPMEKLDLYGTMDAVVCALDSLNHVTAEIFTLALDRLRLFTAPGGIFVFDLNTAYKHRQVLADQCYVYEREEVFCCWQNELLEDDAVEVTLDFFEPDGDRYRRRQERFQEYLHSEDAVRRRLENAGFDLLALYDADTENPPRENSERLVYVARKR